MIFGGILSLLTFPGLISKHIIEKRLAEIMHVEKSKNEKDNVEYEYTVRQLALKLIAQFLLNTVLGAGTLLLLKVIVKDFDLIFDSTIPTVLLWLGMSFLIHSFPTISEGKYAYKRRNNGNFMALSLGIFFIAFLDYFWASILYSFLIYFAIDLIQI